MAHIQKRFIVWIKKRDEVDDACFQESGMEVDAYNHPALVIRPALLAHEQVVICILTSFGNQSILERHPNIERQKDYLPVAPSPPSTSGPQPLRMRHKPLRKNSYIAVKRVLKVQPAALEKYCRRSPADHYQLDAASFKIVLKELVARNLIETTSTRTARRQPVYPLSHGLEEPYVGVQRSAESARLVTPAPFDYDAWLQAARSARAVSNNPGYHQYGTVSPARQFLPQTQSANYSQVTQSPLHQPARINQAQHELDERQRHGAGHGRENDEHGFGSFLILGLAFAAFCYGGYRLHRL